MIKSLPTAEVKIATDNIGLFIYCQHSLCIIVYLAAPSQPPGAIEWNLTNSKIFLKWEHVKALQNESKVTGYKVSFSEK